MAPSTFPLSLLRLPLIDYNYEWIVDRGDWQIGILETVVGREGDLGARDYEIVYV